jgi:hypothetical protein
MKHYFLLLAVIAILGLYKPVFSQVPNEFYYVNALKSVSKSEVVKIIQDEFTGDYIVAGRYRNTINLDPTSSTPTHSGMGSMVSYIAKYDIFGDYIWSISLHGNAGTDTVSIKSIDVGIDGYIYAVGYYTNSLQTSYPATFVPNLTKTASQAEGFVARINPYQENDLSQFMLPLGNATSGIKTYINDCKYVHTLACPLLVLCGEFIGDNIDINLDNTKTNIFSSPFGTYSGFITSIHAINRTTSSAFMPLVLHGNTTGNNISIEKLCIPKHNFNPTFDTLNFAGVYNGTTNTTPSFTSLGNTDILLGTTLIIFVGVGPDLISVLGYGSIGSPGADGVSDMIINIPNEKIFLSGYFNGSSMDADPSANTADLGSSIDVDAFLGKYSRNFSYMDAGKFSGAGKEKITSLALWDGNGDTLLIGGYFTGTTITHGSSTLHTNTASGTSDAFMNLIKTNTSTLNFLTSVKIGSSGNEFINSVAVSYFGEAIAGGAFSGTVDFDNSSSVYEETSGGSTNGFMCFYGEDLSSFVDSYTSGNADDEVTEVSVDEKGDIFAIGTYTGSITIGTNTLNSAGGTDVFIQRKNKNGNNQWAFNTGRVASSNTITDICAKINSTANDKARSVVTSDTSVYIGFVRNDTAYTQRVNKNTGGPIWTQKINKNGSNIGGITTDAQYVYIVGDSAGVQITQRVNKNTGGPIWTQRSAGGKAKAITQDIDHVYTIKDSSGHAVVSRVNKNTGGPIWTQRVAGNSGTSITTLGNDLYIMSDSAGTILLKKVNKNTGGPIWTQKVGNGTLGNVSVNAGKGNLYITGTFTGSSSYLGLTSSGGTDGFVARVNKNTGGPIWTQRVGGTGADSIKTLQITAGNDIYIGGNTQGGTFGTSTASAGVFLVRLSVDSLDKISSILPLNIQPDAFNCQIYPNPTHDMFNISAVLPKTELVQIRMVDLRGKIVHQELFGNQTYIQNTVDIGELPNGVYILQIQAGDKQVIRKVIKQ